MKTVIISILIIMSFMLMAGCSTRYIGGSPSSSVETATLDFRKSHSNVQLSSISPTQGSLDVSLDLSWKVVYLSAGWWDIAAYCGVMLLDTTAPRRSWVSAGKRYKLECDGSSLRAELVEIESDDYIYFETWTFKETWIRLNLYEDKLLVRTAISGTSRTESDTLWCDARVDPEDFNDLLSTISRIGVFQWEREYSEASLDGFRWEIQVRSGDKYYEGTGGNSYPAGFPDIEIAINQFLESTECAAFGNVTISE